MTSPIHLVDLIDHAPPTPWAEGDNIPWHDPAFSARMLDAHLDPSHHLASRSAPIIAQQVEWLHTTLCGRTPRTILDLGCGPGLYLHPLAERGHRCIGLDFGPASIDYARRRAVDAGLTIDYRLADIRSAPLPKADVILLIYGQLNVFRRAEAADLLRRCAAALSPGGQLVLEPQSAESVQAPAPSSWQALATGLFSERPHLLLYERAWHADDRCRTERWHVVDAATATVERHAMSTVAYDEAELRALLKEAGFVDARFGPALPGNPADNGLFGVIARRG